MSDSPKKEVRVRFAPSPTGPFTLGNARTALFNWLFARHEKGEFFVRIEDTDKERSKKEYEEEILEGLKWLGLNWENDIIRQSERLDLYAKYLSQLLSQKKAYYCFCTPEELEIERQAQLSQGIAPKYSGRCRALSEGEVKSRLEKQGAVIRFKTPEKEVVFTDLVRGKVKFDARLFGDVIIAKGLQEPLYNFAAVVDDYEMRITHVIRGEDHLPNTPKQWLLQEALGFEHPEYAHLPLILGRDRRKLSKRLMDTSLLNFREQGYLPEALLNFLGLLGWHPEEDREVLTLEETIHEFSLKRVQKGSAIFNQEKLDWLNAHYIKTMPIHELQEHLKPFLPASWSHKDSLLIKVIEIEKERLRRLGDLPNLAGFFFTLPEYPKQLLNWRETNVQITFENLLKASEALKNLAADQFTKAVLEEKIMPYAEARGRGEVLWPLRVALSGQENSPGPFEIMDVLGKEETIRRVEYAIEKLSNENEEAVQRLVD